MRIRMRLMLAGFTLLSFSLLSACKLDTPTMPLFGGPITITPPPSERVVPSVTPVKTATPPEPTTTRVLIDGQAGDWVEYPILLTDWEDDADQGGFDLKGVRAFSNDQYFYLMLEGYGEIKEYVQIDLHIDVNSDGDQDYEVTFQPGAGEHDLGDLTSGDPVWGLLANTSSAEGEVIEFKMPLTFLGGSDQFILKSIRVMGGTCCEEEWYVVDDMGPISIIRTNELEMTYNEQYHHWLFVPFSEAVSAPFIINDRSFAGARGLEINELETYVYVINEFSGELITVNVDAQSARFGQTGVVKEDIYVLNDVDVNQDETLAYLSRETREDGSSVGQNIITRLYFETGEVVTVVDELVHPTNFVLSQDEKSGFIVDLAQGGLFEVNLANSVVKPVVSGLKEPFAVAVNQAETMAYVVTVPAQEGEYPKGDLLSVDIAAGEVTTVSAEAILGATDITLTSDGRVALVTEFGHEGSCDGSLSVFNVDPDSSAYGEKIVLVSGLCGPHDVKLNRAETLAYFVELDVGRLSVVRVNMAEVLSQFP